MKFSDIVKKAKAKDELKKFIQYIEKTDVVEYLNNANEGDLTVFAPIDAAFEARKDELDNLENEDLRKILLRHVVIRKLMPDDIPRGITKTGTLAGQLFEEKIDVDVIKAIFPSQNQDPRIVIKSSAGMGVVINKPIEADNGVLYIVNNIF